MSQRKFPDLRELQNWIEDNENQIFIDFLAKFLKIIEDMEDEIKRINLEPHGELVRNRRVRKTKAEAVDAILAIL